MKRFPSIRKNSEFQIVYRKGHSCANRYLVMYVFPSGQDFPRIGISVSKKNGNSVVRHHLTRLIRESFRLHKDEIEQNVDIVIVARAAAREADYKKIEGAYLHLCGIAGILKKN